MLYRKGGIFFYSRHQKEDIERTKFSGGEKPKVEKYSEMILYLIETAFKLALGGSKESKSISYEGCGFNL